MNQVTEPQPTRTKKIGLKGFVKENWLGAGLFVAFCLLTTILFGGNSAVMAAASIDTSKITGGLNSAEDPIVQLAQGIGHFMLLIVLLVGTLFQFFGREFGAKGKTMWIGGTFATFILFNASSIRDFIIGISSQQG